jgi:hypothetical protein
MFIAYQSLWYGVWFREYGVALDVAVDKDAHQKHDEEKKSRKSSLSEVEVEYLR